MSETASTPSQPVHSDQPPANPAQGSATGIAEDAVRQQLMRVEDPELHMDIVSLGLVYNIQITDSKVHVKMTLTSPGCPYGPMLIQLTRSAMYAVPGVKEAVVEIVWTPPWDPRTMASDDVKATLGIWD